MAISANSIIHYTDKFSILKKILSDRGFKINYCSEKVTTRGGKSYSLGIAMVSFCDIPLADYKKHFNIRNSNNLGYYGDYGIGLNKNWATINGLNPVIYIEYNSYVGTALRKSIDSYINGDITDTKNFQKNEYAYFAGFSKNYQGELKRNDVVVDKSYCFYNEREWRHIPKTKEIGNNEIFIDGHKYLRRKDYYNELISSYRLKFNFNDISYIIVRDSSEVSDLINHLNSIIMDQNDPNFQLLISKIITSEQIISDF